MGKIEGRVRRTEGVGDVVELLEDGRVILKAYASPDGTKLRAVFPELSGPSGKSVTYHCEGAAGTHYVQAVRPRKF